MKTISNILLSVCLCMLLFSACKYDNYSEPSIRFTGQLVNNGEPLQTKHGIIFKLWQYKEDGYLSAGATSIDINMDQEGRFSALLFPGRYKMTVNSGGTVYYIHDWKDFPRTTAGELDTLYFDLSSDKEQNFEVTPFHVIQNFKCFVRNDSVVASFTIHKLTERTDNQVKFRNVALYVSPTMHVNNDTEVSYKVTNPPLDKEVQVRALLDKYYNDAYYVNNYRTYLYARIGISLRLNGQETMYSPVVKVEGIPQSTIDRFKKK